MNTVLRVANGVTTFLQVPKQVRWHVKGCRNCTPVVASTKEVTRVRLAAYLKKLGVERAQALSAVNLPNLTTK